MGTYGLGDGELVSPLGRLWPAYPGHSSRAARAGHRAHAAAPALSYGRVEALYCGAASGRGGRVSAAAAWESGPQAEAPAGGAAHPVLRPGGQGPQHSWPCRGGPQTRGLRWSASLCQAVRLTAARGDDPDGLYGTVVWHIAWAGRTLAAAHAVSVLEPCSPSGQGLAPRQPLQLCDAAQESATRAHGAHPGHGHRTDGPCL